MFQAHPVIGTIHKHLKKNVVAWFTLIEVLIVTSVIGVLASATTSKISSQQEISRNLVRKTMVWQVASAVTSYYSNNRYRPSTLSSIRNYLATTPIDPQKIDTCNLAATRNGELWYARYTNGWLGADEDGFMVFAQLEHAGQWIEYNKIYVLTGSSPCQDSFMSWSRVDRYRIANSVCTSKPWWTESNPWWNGPIALNSLQQDVADVFGNRKAYAAYIGTWERTKPWIGTVTGGTANNRDIDGDTYKDGTSNPKEPNTAAKTNPCIPSQFARNCDYDTDDDGIYDPIEWNNSDTDSDGMPDYMESVSQDRDGDGMGDQYDNERPSCNGQAATIYISPALAGATRVIYVNGWGNHLAIYTGTITISNGNWTVVWTAGNDIIKVWNGNQTVCGWDGNNTITVWNGNQTVIWWNGNDYVRIWDGNQKVYLWDGSNDAKVWNGNQTLVWWNGYDKVEAWDGNHTISLWTGDDLVYHVWNGNTSIACGAWTDNVREKWQGQFACSSCESGCTTSWSPTIPTAATWVTYPSTANTATCNAGVNVTASDPDADSYMNATWAQGNYGNADSDGTNPCKPNSRANNCSQKASIQAQFPQWACFDNDHDGYHNNVYHSTYVPVNIALSWFSRDPQDQDPCTPDTWSAACIALQNIDLDGDGYRPNGVGGFDPDDTNPCVPQVFWAWCTRDSDGDTKTDYQEWEFVNTDSFLGYTNTLANTVYAITGYAAIIDLWWVSQLVSWDNLYNRQESDRLTSTTGLSLGADNDNDWVTDELDPANNNACIPDNFAPWCTLDFDQDGISDSQEWSGANTDNTGWFVYDIYPNWIESLFTNTLNYLWLYNPAWNTWDPDLDGVPNQLDPDNGDICVPNTGFDASCLPPAPVIPPPPPVWIDCASMSSLPPGARVYYIAVYK